MVDLRSSGGSVHACGPAASVVRSVRRLALLAPVLVVLGAAAPALALSEGRVYEMVSPVYKAGYGVGGLGIPGVMAAPDGESVVFESLGSFAGSDSTGLEYPYLAHRGPAGWSVAPIDTPAALAPEGGISDFSANLESSIGASKLGPNAGVAYQAGVEAELLWHQLATPDVAANWEVVGGQPLKPLKVLEASANIEEVAASADLCRLVIAAHQTPLLPATVNTTEELYELSRGCDGEPSGLRVLGLNNKAPGKVISPACAAVLGSVVRGGNSLGRSDFNAVSADGSEVFFEAQPDESMCEEPLGAQLFVRLGGSRTVEVSKPVTEACSEVPCPGAAARALAVFEGASEDGSKVFFTTAAPLVSEDKDTGNDLYMATIGCPVGETGCEAAKRRVTSLVRVSHPAAATEVAEVQSVVSLAPDGSRVYFVARGALSEDANAQGQAPVKGAENLYAYDSLTGKLAFVADLCSGPALSGAVEDFRCPSIINEAQSVDDDGLWSGAHPEAQVNVCSRPSASACTGERETGRFLVFSSYGQLTAGDTDNARDVFRYDAVTGALDRVSLGEAGADANGNRDDSPSEPLPTGEPTRFADASLAYGLTHSPNFNLAVEHRLDSRAISEDGSRIVFTTSAPLSPQASNGLPDIYEWHKEAAWSEGRVALISSGSSLTRDTNPVISPDGRDVFFKTAQGLVPQDTDGEADIYDARLGGGFPPPAAEPLECSGDACQGPLTDPAPLLVPGSVSQAPGENLPAPTASTVNAKAKPKAKKKRRRKTPRKRRTARKSSGRSRS